MLYAKKKVPRLLSSEEGLGLLLQIPYNTQAAIKCFTICKQVAGIYIFTAYT